MSNNCKQDAIIISIIISQSFLYTITITYSVIHNRLQTLQIIIFLTVMALFRTIFSPQISLHLFLPLLQVWMCKGSWLLFKRSPKDVLTWDPKFWQHIQKSAAEDTTENLTFKFFSFLWVSRNYMHFYHP